MVNRHRYAFLFLVAVFHPFQVPAGTPQTIALEDAVRLALTQNHELAAARLDVEKADAQVHEAVGYALPHIDFSARYSRALKKPVFFFPNIFAEDSTMRGEVRAIEIGSDNSIDMNLTASQTLFNFAVFTGVGTAKVYANAAREVYRSRELETVTSVRKAFYTVLVAGEVRAMMEENLENAEENLKNVRVLAANGLVSEYDLLRSEVVVANLRPEVIQARNTYTLAINNLKIAIGVPFEQDIVVAGSLEFTPVSEETIAQAPDSVLDTNPGLAAMRLQADVNDARISVEQSNYMPTLSAFANYEYQAQRNDFRFSGNDFIGSSLVGLTLSVNLFSGLQTNARVEQARLDLKQSYEQIAHTEISIRTGVQSTILQLRKAQQQIESQHRAVELAQRGYTIATTRLKDGSATQLEVNDAQLALTRAKVNRIQAIADYLNASADLDQLLGVLPPYVSTQEE